MTEKYRPKIFIKNTDSLGMIKDSIKSKDLDPEMVPILEKFFSLPITPIESCYGHADRNKSPYICYIEDPEQDKDQTDIQTSLKSNLSQLRDAINNRVDGNVVEIDLEETDHGRGPKDYTVRFKITDKKIFQELDSNLLSIIWEEFAKYLSDLK